MSETIKHATDDLAMGDVSLVEIGSRLEGIPMSALSHPGYPYGVPRNVFKAMVAKAGM